MARKASKSDSEDTNFVDSSEKHGTEVHQLPEKPAPVQLQADHKVEMSARDLPRAPHGSDGKPQEMMGSLPAKVETNSTS